MFYMIWIRSATRRRIVSAITCFRKISAGGTMDLGYQQNRITCQKPSFFMQNAGRALFVNDLFSTIHDQSYAYYIILHIDGLWLEWPMVATMRERSSGVAKGLKPRCVKRYPLSFSPLHFLHTEFWIIKVEPSDTSEFSIFYGREIGRTVDEGPPLKSSRFGWCLSCGVAMSHGYLDTWCHNTQKMLTHLNFMPLSQHLQQALNIFLYYM